MTISPDTATEPPILMQALRRLLRPLVRLLIAKQLLYPTLTALLKSLYVEIAADEFEIHGKRQTDSRVSLLTGVHRKDVARLRAEKSPDELPPASVTLGAQLVSRWMADPRFADASGRPCPLPEHASTAPEASFEGLVRSISTDIRSRAVLDELLRLGVVHIDGDGCVCLNADSFVPDRGFEEKAYYFGRNLRDHVAAAARNLQGSDPPLFERSVYYARLRSDSVDELSRLAAQLGLEALREVNRRALKLQSRDQGDPSAVRRMTFGAYFFETELEDAAEAEPPAPDRGDHV